MENIVINNVALNFGGFYSSTHSEIIDNEIENILEEEGLNYDQVSDYIDFKGIHLEYSKRLVEDFNNKFNLNLKFEQLIQPKEYNFHTDEILVEMCMKDYNYLFLKLSKNKLKHKIQDAITRRDGYIPLLNKNELLAEPQFIAEFLLDIVMEDADNDDSLPWFCYDNMWFYEIIESAIDNFREKEIK